MCGSVSLSPTDDRYDGVPLDLPTGAPATDYRAGFSVIIKHNGAAAILIGGQAKRMTSELTGLLRLSKGLLIKSQYAGHQGP
jgi:hypothetical protein